MIILHDAPGRSCFNPVERAMAFLSRSLSGVTLPQFFYSEKEGEKLGIEDADALEQLNFDTAASILQKIWEETVSINGYKVSASRILAGSLEKTNDADDLLSLAKKYFNKPSSLAIKDILKIMIRRYFCLM